MYIHVNAHFIDVNAHFFPLTLDCRVCGKPVRRSLSIVVMWISFCILLQCYSLWVINSSVTVPSHPVFLLILSCFLSPKSPHHSTMFPPIQCLIEPHLPVLPPASHCNLAQLASIHQRSYTAREYRDDIPRNRTFTHVMLV